MPAFLSRRVTCSLNLPVSLNFLTIRNVMQVSRGEYFMTSASHNTEHLDFDHIWAQFNANFPTELHCREELYRMINAQTLGKCHSCGSTNRISEFGARTTDCQDCTRTSWCTANTFFHGIR